MLFEDLAYRVYKSKDYGHSMLWVPKLILGSLYLWPNTKNRFLSTLSCLFLSSSIIITLAGIFGYCQVNGDDFNKLAFALCLMMVPIVAIIKFPIVWYKMEEINRLLLEIKEDFWPYDLVDVETKTRIESIYTYTVIFMLWFFGLCQMYTVLAFSIPLLTSQKDLPYPFDLPIPWYNSPSFEIIYIIQLISIEIGVACAAVGGTDCMVLGICGGAANQYRILQKCFEAFNTDQMIHINDKLRKNGHDFKGKYVVEKEYFIRCVQHHDFLLRFTKQINQAFNPLELGNLFLSLFGICLGVFIATKPETPTLQIITIMIYTTGFLSQLAIDCYVGTDLYYQATLIPDSIFKSNWIAIESTEFKKDIMFVIQHSQRYPIFTAYGLYDMNITSYIKVLKTAFSMYTLLKNISKK